MKRSKRVPESRVVMAKLTTTTAMKLRQKMMTASLVVPKGPANHWNGCEMTSPAPCKKAPNPLVLAVCQAS